MTMFSGWITTTKCGWDWGRPYLLLRFRFKRPGAPLAAARRDLPRRIPIVDTLWPAPRKQSNCESSPPQLGDRSPNVESASKHPLPFRLSERLVPPLHLSPEASSHRDSFFAATPPSFTMSPIIWCAPGLQGSFTPPFPPGAIPSDHRLYPSRI
jgi:hypothetical protein